MSASPRRERHVAGGALARRAYHEAGHAVVALELGATVRSVSIRRDGFGRPGGHVHADQPWWKGAVPSDADLPRSAVLLLAGLAAESIVSTATVGEDVEDGDLYLEWLLR